MSARTSSKGTGPTSVRARSSAMWKPKGVVKIPVRWPGSSARMASSNCWTIWPGRICPNLPPFPCNRNSARPLQQTAARAPTLPAPPRSPPALPPHCAPGRRVLQCGPPEITPGCESSPGSPDRKLPPCVAPPGALRPSSPHMYAAGGTAARSTAAAPLCRPSRGRWRLVSAVRLPARPPAYRQAAITGRPQLHQHAVDCRVLRGHAQLPRPLGFIGDGLKTEVAGEALLFLANPLLRHGLPIHQVWHSYLLVLTRTITPPERSGTTMSGRPAEAGCPCRFTATTLPGFSPAPI